MGGKMVLYSINKTLFKKPASIYRQVSFVGLKALHKGVRPLKTFFNYKVSPQWPDTYNTFNGFQAKLKPDFYLLPMTFKSPVIVSVFLNVFALHVPPVQSLVNLLSAHSYSFSSAPYIVASALLIF